MMNGHRHREVKDILATVLERGRSERAAFLDARCGDDPALRREVESLLAFETADDDWIGPPLVSIRPEMDTARKAGERIGPYRIVRSLGCGGMGEVYLAHEEGPVERPVALKLIHRGMSTVEILARFRMERQILASLNHPYIGGLLHAGASDDGRPYFAMEYVEGVRIDRYCDAHGLGVRERLDLFLKVCAAVHFSHQKLVVHRDLKPANILVTTDGTPKLLDFGIAKLLEPSARPFTTVLGHGPMTPAYASPELVRHQPVTTASDVYSLGVLLYLLLTGRHPYRIAGRRGDEVGRIICEEEPRKPSGVAGRELAGDLDSILLQALRKDPEERYGSVEKLADDLQRHLEGRPVSARAATWRYRAGKFARRHRLPLATAAVFALVVAAFVVALLLQLGRVQLERDRANMARDLVVEIMENADAGEGGNLAPDDVVQRGVAFFGESFRRRHDVQGDVLNSLGRVYLQRGFPRGARPLLEESLQLRRRALGPDHFLVGESLLNLSSVFRALADYERAELLSRQGLQIFRRHYGRRPHRQLAKGVSVHGTQLYHLSRHEEAEALHREALTMRIDLYGERHLEVAKSLTMLGTIFRATRDYQEALAHYRRALDIRLALLPPTHPDVARLQSLIGSLLYERGEIEAAEPLLREALMIRRQRYGDGHRDVASSRYALALLLHRSGRDDEAETLYRQALDARREIYGEDHVSSARVEKKLAALLLERGDLASARPLAMHAVRVFEREGSATEIADARSVLGAVLDGAREQER